MADNSMTFTNTLMQLGGEDFLRELSGFMLTLYTILCKCLFSEVTVQAVTELHNKAAHCHTPVPQQHRPFL
ncbi:hypothetical protein ABN154_28600 [Klebsiella michiganensis]|uniref:hypothetical protein n=1 Tax=Klebsiella michiganensis TaxID=1134687 RepID=UPI0032DBC5DB